MPENKCPSCGFEIELENKPLCRYCYMRNTLGTMKMEIMKIFEGGDKLSAKDVMEKLNALPYIRQPISLLVVKKYLIDYTRFGMLSSSKERKKRVGRPTLLRKITSKGQKRLKMYLKKWNHGFIVLLKERHRKLRTTSSSYSERASAIRGKILNDKNYNSFEFIFPQRINKLQA